MREIELLARVEHAARAVFHASAAAAVEDDPRAIAVARAASLVTRIAAFLRPLPVRHPGELRILRARVARLLELTEDEDLRRELAAIDRELGDVLDGEPPDSARVAEAFDRKVG